MREPVTMTSSTFCESAPGAAGSSAAFARWGDAAPPSAAATASETRYGAALPVIKRRLSATVFRVVIDIPQDQAFVNSVAAVKSRIHYLSALRLRAPPRFPNAYSPYVRPICCGPNSGQAGHFRHYKACLLFAKHGSHFPADYARGCLDMSTVGNERIAKCCGAATERVRPHGLRGDQNRAPPFSAA
jgi:hypothetical protein